MEMMITIKDRSFNPAHITAVKAAREEITLDGSSWVIRVWTTGQDKSFPLVTRQKKRQMPL